MNITNIHFFDPPKNNPKIYKMVDILIDSCLIVSNIEIWRSYQHDNPFYISYPNDVRPIGAKSIAWLENVIISKLKQYIDSKKESRFERITRRAIETGSLF